MAMTGLDTFDTAVQKSERWIHEVMEQLEWSDRHRTYSVLRAVLLNLRNQLTVDVSANLSAQLPLVLRGLYYDQWNPSAVPVKERSLQRFLERVAQDASLSDTDEALRATRAVLGVLEEHTSEGVEWHLAEVLPDEFETLLARA